MSRLFISRSGQLRERWAAAFEDARADVGLDPAAAAGCASVWLELDTARAARREAAVRDAVAAGRPVIAMAPVPSEADAFALLQAGARGYCHLEAAPEQLREIALVVEHGGLWMPPELTQRVLGLSLRVVPTPPPQVLELDALTSRELMVAEQVARGASNREIAQTLSISERTVKAHLTAIFDKLGVRDRVQLALAMNNISTHSTVN
ncbi:MAG: helix-turn-helix transcriptional regulator [Halioglobus sp.]|nr:helix-turn-helix transcriptional regulator [Halioglobus sp.]MAT92728.1 helix-turn-helix transcriptional regulator [Halioglobus sp.]|tara:strand:+ start:1187 stop:1807 length:621 start_codon:yes stop_codon:yes gene_type:complete